MAKVSVIVIVDIIERYPICLDSMLVPHRATHRGYIDPGHNRLIRVRDESRSKPQVHLP